MCLWLKVCCIKYKRWMRLNKELHTPIELVGKSAQGCILSPQCAAAQR